MLPISHKNMSLVSRGLYTDANNISDRRVHMISFKTIEETQLTEEIAQKSVSFRQPCVTATVSR